MLAHNTARSTNAQSRFYIEFKDLAEKEGHCVRSVNANLGNTEDEDEFTMNAHKLLSVRDMTFAEFTEVEQRIMSNTATESDKFAVYKHKYKRAWGIDVVTEDFIRDNGTNIFSSSVHMAMRILFPDMFYTDNCDVNAPQQMLKISVFEELMSILGFKHVFDTRSVELESTRAAILRSSLFADYTNNVMLFTNRKKAAKQLWTNKNIIDNVRTVFSAFGMKIVSTRERETRYNVCTVTHRYTIDQDKARHLASLINLRRGNAVCANEDAQRFLDSVGYGEYADNITTNTHTNVVCSIEPMNDI